MSSFTEAPTDDEIAKSITRPIAQIVREMCRAESLVWFERKLVAEVKGSLSAEVVEQYRRELEKVYGPGFEESWRPEHAENYHFAGEC